MDLLVVRRIVEQRHEALLVLLVQICRQNQSGRRNKKKVRKGTGVVHGNKKIHNVKSIAVGRRTQERQQKIEGIGS